MDTIREILGDINNNPADIEKHKSNNFFRIFMETAFLPEKKLPFPETDPPYKPSNIESEVQTKGIVWQFIRKLDSLRNPNLPDLRRETMFIGFLENITMEEAVLFLHVKDQTIPELYPNITLDMLKKANYFNV